MVEGAVRRLACWLCRRDRDDRHDVVARLFRCSDTAGDHWRSTFGFHSAGTISFAHGKGRRLQTPETAWGWIDDRRPAYCWRDWRSDSWIVHAAQCGKARDARNDLRLCRAAAHCSCNCTLAGAWDKLHWIAHCCCAPGYARRFRALRFCFRANACFRFSISRTVKKPERRPRIQSGDWAARTCAERNWGRDSRWWGRIGTQALSRSDVQLRRYAIQRPRRPTDYPKRIVLLRDQKCR